MVPEAIMARYLGLDMAGPSLVTNLAAGRSASPLDHHDVLQCGKDACDHFSLLLNRLLQLWTVPTA